MVIKHNVPASMRADTYKTTIAHTADDILAVEYDCKAGSKYEDEIVCVHVLPIVYKVRHLLLEDQSKHMLLELTSCLASLMENWSVDIVTRVK